MKRQIFYSFHYDNDVFRVQQIRNIGSLEDNKPISPNEWEQVKKDGDVSIKRWIDDNLRYKSCLVVLIGSETANRKWVRYEIEKSWDDGKGVLGVFIHNINCMKNGTCLQGANPFEYTYSKYGTKISSLVKTYNPSPNHAYKDIANSLEHWIEDAISSR